MTTIGHAIKIARLSKNLNQKELAAKSGITDNFLSRIEAGSREPSWSTLQAVAAGLQVPVTVLTVLVEFDQHAVAPFVPLAYMAVLTENDNGKASDN